MIVIVDSSQNYLIFVFVAEKKASIVFISATIVFILATTEKYATIVVLIQQLL